MIFADTVFLVALVQPRDQFYRRVRAWSNAIADSMVTTEYVLCEFANSLSRPILRPKVHASLDKILAAKDWEVVPASTGLFTNGLQLHRQHADKEWSLT